jgi:hypothetical protein
LRLGSQAGQGIRIAGPWREHPGGGEARLPGVGERELAQGGGRRGQVGVFQHDRRGPAAEFQVDRLERLAADHRDTAAEGR